MATPPDWLAAMVNDIALRILPVDPLAPIGCHYAHVDDCWEVTLFVSASEVVGGEYDGERFASAYQFDLVGVEAHFDDVTALGWQPIEFGEGDDVGPHIAIEGVRDGHQVWVRVAAFPPAHLEAGRIFNVLNSTIDELW